MISRWEAFKGGCRSFQAYRCRQSNIFHIMDYCEHPVEHRPVPCRGDVLAPTVADKVALGPKFHDRLLASMVHDIDIIVIRMMAYPEAARLQKHPLLEFTRKNPPCFSWCRVCGEIVKERERGGGEVLSLSHICIGCWVSEGKLRSRSIALFFSV